jgi:hypothetical protein
MVYLDEVPVDGVGHRAQCEPIVLCEFLSDVW